MPTVDRSDRAETSVEGLRSLCKRAGDEILSEREQVFEAWRNLRALGHETLASRSKELHLPVTYEWSLLGTDGHSTYVSAYYRYTGISNASAAEWSHDLFSTKSLSQPRQ